PLDEVARREEAGERLLDRDLELASLETRGAGVARERVDEHLLANAERPRRFGPVDVDAAEDALLGRQRHGHQRTSRERAQMGIAPRWAILAACDEDRTRPPDRLLRDLARGGDLRVLLGRLSESEESD